MNGWIGVDLDGTLAEYHGWKGADHIGNPVPKMLGRVKKWRAEGKDVRILTARVCNNNPTKAQALTAIQDWCQKHIGEVLPITAEKDYCMVEMWDDRCIQVVPNTGIAIQEFISKK